MHVTGIVELRCLRAVFVVCVSKKEKLSQNFVTECAIVANIRVNA